MNIGGNRMNYYDIGIEEDIKELERQKLDRDEESFGLDAWIEDEMLLSIEKDERGK